MKALTNIGDIYMQDEAGTLLEQLTIAVMDVEYDVMMSLEAGDIEAVQTIVLCTENFKKNLHHLKH